MADNSSFELTETIYNQELLDLIKTINPKHSCLTEGEQLTIRKIQTHEPDVLYSKPKSQIGRYVVHQSAFVEINSEWRHSLCGTNNIVRCDFRSSAPTELHNYSTEHEMNTPHLYQYTNDRASVWAKMTEHFGTDNKQNKQLINSLSFGGTVSAWGKRHNIKLTKTKIAKVPFLAGFENDVSQIIKRLQSTNDPLYHECYNYTKNFKGKDHNEEHSALANWCYEREAQQIRQLITHCGKIGLYVSSYINDEVHIDLNKSSAFDDANVDTLKQWVKIKFKKTLTIEPIVPSEEVLERVHAILDEQTEPSLDYEAVKEDFEKTHAKINDPCCYICTTPNHKNKLNVYSEKGLDERYRNLPCDKGLFVKFWREDPHIRTYEYMDLFPPPLICPKECFNLWSGFAVEQWEPDMENGPAAWDMFNEIVKVNCEENEEMFEYMSDLLAQTFQSPGVLAQIAVIILSPETGTGKGAFLSALKALMGDECAFKTNDPQKEVFGAFNAQVKGKILIHLEEVEKAKTKHITEQMKDIIDSDTLNINEKYKTTITVHNFGRVIATSNNTDPITIQQNDRRFFATRCTKKYQQNVEFFAKFKEVVTDNKGNLRYIFDRIMEREITRKNWIQSRPLGRDYKSIQSGSVKSEIHWLHNLCQSAKSEPHCFLASEKWYEYYKEYLTDYFPTYEKPNVNRFGRMMTAFSEESMGIEKTSQGQRKGYKLWFETLREYLDTKYKGQI